jgi:hypothetical protein
MPQRSLRIARPRRPMGFDTALSRDRPKVERKTNRFSEIPQRVAVWSRG